MRMKQTLSLVVSLLFPALFATQGFGQSTKPDIAIDPNAPRVGEIQAMLTAPAGLGQPITNRKVWDAFAATPRYQHIVAAAEGVVDAPLPEHAR